MLLSIFCSFIVVCRLVEVINVVIVKVSVDSS